MSLIKRCALVPHREVRFHRKVCLLISRRSTVKSDRRVYFFGVSWNLAGPAKRPLEPN